MSTPPPEMMSRADYPYAAGHKDDGASRDAAINFTAKLPHRRAEVLRAYRELGSATPDQIAKHVGRPAHVVRPRVSELYLLGEVVKTGERRRSSFGASQSVYRLATEQERSLFAARKAAEWSATEDRDGHS